MIWMLERFLTEEEFYGFLRDVTNLVKNYLEVNAAGAHLLDDLGFRICFPKCSRGSMRIRTFASGRDWLSYETALSPFMAI